MARTCNMTCTMDMHEKVDIERMLISFQGQVRVTGRDETFNWSMPDLGFTLVVKGKEFHVHVHQQRESHQQEVKTLERGSKRNKQFLIHLDALLRINSFYASGKEEKSFFILSNKDTKFTNRLFHSVTWNIENSGITALVYKSGKIVVLGCQDDLQITKAANMIVDSLQREFFIMNGSREYEVKNIVKTGKMTPEGIQLCNLSKHLRDEMKHVIKHVIYEPELFPALHCMIGSITCSIFSTSKVILTGSTDHKKIEDAFKLLSSIVTEWDMETFIERSITEFTQGIL